MEFFYVVRATQKSGKPDAVVWFTAKSEARANLQLDVELEDAGIETGRGADYKLPVRTDFPVFNDLPEEATVDYTWCDRYELEEDGRTWQLKSGQTPKDGFHPGPDDAGTTATTTSTGPDGLNEDVIDAMEHPVAEMPFRKKLLSQFLCDECRHHMTPEQRREIAALEMDVDNNYVQNLMLAAENIPEAKKFCTHDIWKFTAAVKTVFPTDAKAPDLGLMKRFMEVWVATEYIDRGLLVKEWVAGNRVSAIQRTDSGTNAGGGIPTDRSPDYVHTLDTLDVEIACATLPMDFDIYEIPVSVHRRAKDIVAAKESPFKEWSAALRKIPGILDYSRAAIFALIREASSEITPFPSRMQGYINANLTEHEHGKPTPETLAAAHQVDSAAVVAAVVNGAESVESPADIVAASAPSLAAASAPEETPAPEEPAAPQYPEYFEPGRYEDLPNNIYHAANGISSTQVKDARVSLMFYHGRHVTRTIRRESSEALAFGSLAHTMALEPEKLDEEFAVFPGIPAEAFTTTDSLKAFIREYNADRPKTGQLKLTGKKEELQEAIRAVNPDAIFADEFEQQWRDANDGKTILSSQQLAQAKAIQQALLNHESAGKLLRHPSRAVETSYFGFDDETGLEVRVRPDLEVEINSVRIGVDLKTISMGRIKQDGLRARLHREIIDRDYHISAGMYSRVADFDQFFWIFVNKDEGHHWVAVIEASQDLLDLGLLEYQKTMRALATAYDTDCWPAPINADYTDELNDFDLRRLEVLRTQA